MYEFMHVCKNLCMSLYMYVGVRACSGVNLVRSLGVVNLVAEIFDSSRKNFRFSGKNYDDFFFVVNSQNCLFSLNIHIFTFCT